MLRRSAALPSPVTHRCALAWRCALSLSLLGCIPAPVLRPSDAARGDAGPSPIDAILGEDVDTEIDVPRPSGDLVAADTCGRADDPTSCGPGCLRCPVPQNGTATCVDGRCGLRCAAGHREGAGRCVTVEAPRPLSPLSTTYVTSRRPRLRWSLPEGVDGAEVIVCARPDCAAPRVTFEVRGSEAVLSEPLATGTWFWKLRGRAGDVRGVLESSVWQFTVRGDNPDGVVLHGPLDVDGDALADLVVGAPATSAGAGRVWVFAGADLLSAPRVLAPPMGAQQAFGRQVVSAGDLNGDGLADLAIASGAPAESGALSVILGRSSGDLVSLVDVRGVLPGERFAARLAPVGDVNGDGYGDLTALSTSPTVAARLLLFAGGPVGPRSLPQQTWELNGEAARQVTFVAAADFDRDGFHDVALGLVSETGDVCELRIANGGSTGLSLSASRRVVLPLSCAGGNLSGVVAGDLDGDGYPDLVVSGADRGRLMVLALRGGAMGLASSATTRWANPVPGGPSVLQPTQSTAAGDLTGDGRIDTLLQTRVMRLNTTPFLSPTVLDVWHQGEAAAPSPLPLSLPSHAVALADYSGDAIADFVAGDPTAEGGAGVVHVFVGRPGGPSSTPGRTIRAPGSGVVGFGASIAQ